MTNDNKPPMFGPSSMFDPFTHEPRSGTSALMNELMAEFAGKPNALASWDYRAACFAWHCW